MTGGAHTEGVAALLKIAKEATNGWGCYARTKREHAEIARLHTAIRTAEAANPECPWSVDEDGVWEGGCEITWVCETGTPAENGMRFCPRCGRRLVVIEVDLAPCALGGSEGSVSRTETEEQGD